MPTNKSSVRRESIVPETFPLSYERIAALKTVEPLSDIRHGSHPTAETVIFLHVPKTAGTTLNRLIEWEYPILQMYSVDPVFSAWSRKHLRKLSVRRLRQIRMLKGHMVFGMHEILPQPASYITVLRDPINRVLSAFYFMHNYRLHPYYWNFRRRYPTLDDFVHRSPRKMSNARFWLEWITK